MRRRIQSTDDTFERDVPLSETEPLIRRLAEKTWIAAQKESRTARTVDLKLKTSEFRILTRCHTPSPTPSSCDEVTGIALSLRERVDLGSVQLFRLVGVGLGNFMKLENMSAQPDLFEGQNKLADDTAVCVSPFGSRIRN
jgi:DNA polymerase IV